MVDPATNAPWDLSKKDTQNEVKKIIIDGKPFMVIGSPPCTAFWQLQGFNNFKRDPQVVEKELAEACAHIVFCFEMHEFQGKAGRFSGTNTQVLRDRGSNPRCSTCYSSRTWSRSRLTCATSGV